MSAGKCFSACQKSAMVLNLKVYLTRTKNFSIGTWRKRISYSVAAAAVKRCSKIPERALLYCTTATTLQVSGPVLLQAPTVLLSDFGHHIA